MNIQDVRDVVELAVKVNSTSARKKELTGNLPTVFFAFYGHDVNLEIRVYENGWEPGEMCDKLFLFSLEEPFLWKDFIAYRDYMEGLYARTV